MNKRKIGSEYEDKAASFLEGQGYRIICRNFYCKAGELDLIARDRDYLCFIEVKYRSGRSLGLPEEAVDVRKIKRISKCAAYYCYKMNLGTDVNIRFDVVSIEGDSVRLIKDAFEYCE